MESKQVNLYRKISVVQAASGEDGADSADASQAQRVLAKKKLNIPICDVHMDKEYERNVTASFALHPSYVKHSKKIGDEVDVSIDCVVDASDKHWVAATVRADSNAKELAKLFTHEAFETVINILERYTAFSRDPIPMIHAQKVIVEQLNWKPAHHAAAEQMVGEVYKYWLAKRERVGKPLCRRYWPQIASSDSNPHQVFRTRDKEKYRLRKQQKRNDVEAFRKMQQLRRDFSKAKVLTELILERELLREADFTVQREQFDQREYDLQQLEQQQQLVSESGASDASSNGARRRQEPYRHVLKFDHIDPNETPADKLRAQQDSPRPQSPFSRLMALSASSTDSLDDTSPARQRSSGGGNGSINGGMRKSGSATDLKKGLSAVSGEKKVSAASAANKAAEESKKKAAAAATAVEKKKKKESSRLVMYTVTNGLTVELGSGVVMPPVPSSSGGGAVSSSSNSHAATSSGGVDVVTVNGGDGGGEGGEGSDLRLIHPDLDGPAFLCQPQWPSFMADIGLRDANCTRQQVSSSTVYVRYGADLELRHDDRTGEVLLPIKYRTRSRVGRGGRLVMDRIPVYEEPPLAYEDYWNTDEAAAAAPRRNHSSANVIYTTTLRYQFQQQQQQQQQQQARDSFGSGRPPLPLAANGSTTGIAASPDSGVSMPPGVSGPGAPTVSIIGSRHLPEVPLSNRKIAKYNMKVRANNQLISSNIGGGAMGPALMQKSVPDIPSFAPGAQLQLTAPTRQRLAEICAESDSEDERVVLPRAMRGHPEIERSVVTKASLAALVAGIPGLLDSNNNAVNSSANVKFSVKI